jgi:hypothetical protein
MTTAEILRDLAAGYRSQADLFRGAPPNSSGEATASTLLDVARDLENAADEAEGS